MNPIKITLLSLGIWILLTIIGILTVEDVSEKSFVVAVYSFYLSPLICIITFISSAFFYRSWIRNHRIGVAIFVVILFVWLLYIIFYIQSLFI
jgi:hypothetical protein